LKFRDADKPVYKGHSWGPEKCALYIRIIIICSIHKWENDHDINEILLKVVLNYHKPKWENKTALYRQ
jgi:hypothetical protein